MARNMATDTHNMSTNQHLALIDQVQHKYRCRMIQILIGRPVSQREAMELQELQMRVAQLGRDWKRLTKGEIA